MQTLRLLAPLLVSSVAFVVSNSSTTQAQTVPTFTVQTYPSRTNARFGVKADINNDGVPDLLLCCGPSGNVWYQLSDGAGAFLAPVTLGPIYQFGFSITTGDFNSDGRTDVAVPNPSGGITIHYNQGGGAFTTKNYFGGSNPREVVVADFNHDKNLDIAFTPNKQGVPVLLALGDGKGNFTPPVSVYSSSAQASAFNLVAGDFDGDGNADLAFVLQSCFRGGCNTSDVVVLYGAGNGMFTSKTFPSSFYLFNISSFDVNRTGRSDLTFVTGCSVVSCGDSIGVLFGTASRNLTQKLIQPQHFDPNSLGVDDLNGDLQNDIIDSYGAGNTEGALFALATSASSWNTQIEYPVTTNGEGFSVVLVGDFNRDRKPDVVLYNPISGVIQELVNTTATGNYGSCSYPNTGQGIHVCSPTGGSTHHSPVRFIAAANSFQPIRKMELWIDGKKAKEQFRSWLDFTTALSLGTHKVGINAVGYDADFQHKSFTFTVN
jgi:hypothetical protein